jgi:hypothetical protein
MSLVHSATLDWGDLIQIADPDVLSNTAKQEMKMEKQLVQREVRLGSASNFETILTVRELRSPAGTFELKFETAFAGAKDDQARQTKAQFFVGLDGLQSIQDALVSVSSSTAMSRSPSVPAPISLRD